MNTTGFMRGYMAKNMSAEKFIKVSAEALAREFEEEVKVILTAQNEYEILFKDYKAYITVNLIDNLRARFPYAVDKFLLQ
jgi:hypothetical protein